MNLESYFRVGGDRAHTHAIKKIEADLMPGGGVILELHTDRDDKRLRVDVRPQHVLDLLNKMLESMPFGEMVSKHPDHPIIETAKLVAGAVAKEHKDNGAR